MKLKNKAWNWVKDHKIETCVALLGVAGTIYLRHKVHMLEDEPICSFTGQNFNKNDLPIPEDLEACTVMDLWKDGGKHLTSICQDIKIENLGNFGKDLLKMGFDPEHSIGAIIEDVTSYEVN